MRRSAIEMLVAGLCAGLVLACGSAMSAEQTKIPDLSGAFAHNISHFWPPESGPGPVTNAPGKPHLYGQDVGKGLPGTRLWIGDPTSPILKPWAANAVRTRAAEEIGRDESPWQPLQLCRLVGTPHVLLLREPVVFLQEAKMVTMIYQRDQQTRRVYLGEQHPKDLAPTPYGHSVGRYEGDSLVVDTVGMTAEGMIDYFGTPATESMRVVERYRLIDNGQTLEARFTVEDPATFTTPWSGIQRYRRVRAEAWEEIRCAENPKDSDGSEYPIPKDEWPDF